MGNLRLNCHGMQSMRYSPPVFFFPVKIKVPVKAIFGRFLVFFTGKNQFSRPLFYQILSFFTATFFFTGTFLGFFSRVAKIVFTGRIRKKNSFCFQFHGEKDGFFSRASTSVSRVEFLENFHGQISIFTGTF